jgi:hypothetical protein
VSSSLTIHPMLKPEYNASRHRIAPIERHKGAIRAHEAVMIACTCFDGGGSAKCLSTCGLPTAPKSF